MSKKSPILPLTLSTQPNHHALPLPPMSRLPRLRGPLLVLGASATTGATYRYFNPPSPTSPPLHTHNFAPYTLISKHPVSSTSAIFTLRHTTGAREPDSAKEAAERGVWSVQVKQPQLQIGRAYTPLPSRGEDADTEYDAHEVRLLIRREAGGEVSTYLHGLDEGSTIELRGPNVEAEVPPDVGEVVFLAGGTGVAPAMQVARVLGGRAGSKMEVLWANRRREECVGGVSDDGSGEAKVRELPWWKRLLGLGQAAGREGPVGDQEGASKGLIVRELEALKERSRAATRGLHVQYYVDEEKTFIKPGDVAKRLRAETLDGGKGSRLILVSGPDGFIEYWAGRKQWVDGREVQGPLGGVLAKMDLKDWKVLKL